MMDHAIKERQTFSIEDRLEIESICDRFEEQLSDGHDISITTALSDTKLASELQNHLVYELVRLALDHGRPDLPQTYLAKIGHHHTAEVARACRHYGNPELTTLIYSGAKKIHIEGFPGNDRFRCIRHLGSGGMGHVYEVWDLERHMPMALKTLHSLSGRTLEGFKREFRTLAAIDHRNLVRLYEFFQSDQHWFFTMEIIEGLDVLNYCHGNDQPDFDRVRSCFGQLATGLNHLHSQEKLHRDIKPSNLLVTTDGTLKILDFGLVLELEEDPLKSRSTTGNSMVGTPSYMSPEQMMSKHLTPASDWFSAGVVLHELLTKAKPLAQEKPQEANLTSQKGFPGDLFHLSKGLMASSPSSRPVKEHVFDTLKIDSTPAASPQAMPEVFAGRKKFLKKLKNLTPQSSANQPAIVVLSGKSGEGKSSLANRYLNSIDESSETVILASRCYDHESVQYPGIDGLTDELAQHLSGLPSKDLKEMVPKDISLLIRVFPGLSKVKWAYKGSSDENDSSPKDPRILRERALSSLKQLLRNVAERRPLILFVDDFQWAGNDSTDFLALLAKDPPPCLIFLACRAEHPHLETILETVTPEKEKQPSTNFEHLELPPFTDEEAREVAQKICEQRKISLPSEEDFHRICQESHCHAYLLTELLWNYQSGGGPILEKDSLIEVLHSKILSLSPDARTVLDFVALSVIPLQTRTAYELAGLDAFDPLVVRDLTNEKLISYSQVGMAASLRPYHDAVRAAVDGSLESPARKQRHHELAHWFETQSKNVNAQVVAFHLEEAEELEKASSYYRKAGEQAMQSLAFELASNLFRKALTLNPDLSPTDARAIQEDLANALESADRSYEAAVEFHALGIEQQGSEKTQNLRRAALLYCSSGRLDKGLVLLKDLLHQHGYQVKTDTSLIGNIRWFASQLLLIRKLRKAPKFNQAELGLDEKADLFLYSAAGISLVDPFTAGSLLLKSIDIAFKAGNSNTLGKALALNAAYQSCTHHLLARLSEGTDSLIEEMCTTSDNPDLKGFFLMARGINVEHRSKFLEANPILEEAEEILVTQCYRVWWEIAMVRTCLMWNLCFLARFPELEPRVERYLEEANERNDLFLKSNIGTYVSPLILMSKDEPEKAAKVGDEAIEGWRENPGFHVQHQTYLWARAMTYLYVGDAEGGVEFYEKNWNDLSNAGIFLFDFVEMWAFDIRVTLALGAFSAAENFAKKRYLKIAKYGLKQLKKAKLDIAPILVLRLQGILAYLENDLEMATQHLKQAVAGLEKHGVRGYALSTQHLLTEIEGKEFSDELLQGFQSCGIQNPKRWRRTQMGI